MSTFREIIQRADENKPNAFSDRQKFTWLVTLDGRVAADVLLMDIREIRQLERKYPQDMDAEPLVSYPHQDIYDAWLEAKIDAANGEYDKYQNSMELYNAAYGDFVRWFASSYHPAQGYRGGRCRQCEWEPPYYVTAYGVAVSLGFEGTVEEWLVSLRGGQGDPGKDGKSAYDYALEAGYEGTEETFREMLLGNGKTAYEYAVEGGYNGTAAEFALKMAAEYAPKDHKHAEYALQDHGHTEYLEEIENHTHTAKETGALGVDDSGAITAPLILTEGVHFGDSFPADAAEGTLFFVPAEEDA